MLAGKNANKYMKEIRNAGACLKPAVFGFTLAVSVLWALATWSADRYIASARVTSEGDQTS